MRISHLVLYADAGIYLCETYFNILSYYDLYKKCLTSLTSL